MKPKTREDFIGCGLGLVFGTAFGAIVSNIGDMGLGIALGAALACCLLLR